MAIHRTFANPESEIFAGIYGGKDGFAFDDSVVDGDLIQSLWVASGTLIDSVQIAYRNGHRTSRHGGIGGAGQWITFEPNEMILGLSGHYSVYLEQLSIRTTHRSVTAGNLNSAGLAFAITAPDGHHLIGFHGRCGQYVDAIGARLAPIPAPRNTAAELARAELSQFPTVRFTPFFAERRGR